MTQEEVEKTFGGLSPYYAYKQGLQDGDAYTWESFRREAAKDAMLGILAGRKTHQGIQETAEYAVKYADELIKQLKED